MKEIAAQLNNSIEGFLKTDFTDYNWEYRIANDKWSKKEIIGHLIDSAQVNLQRFIRCTYQENFKLLYEQVEWVKAAYYQGAAIEELLALWRLLNCQIVRVLTNYPDGRADTQCDTGKKGPQLHTVKWLAADYVVHMNHHLNQILVN